MCQRRLAQQDKLVRLYAEAAGRAWVRGASLVGGVLQPLRVAQGREQAKDPGNAGDPAEGKEHPLDVAAAAAVVLAGEVGLPCSHAEGCQCHSLH